VEYTLFSTAALLRVCATASGAEPWEELIRRFHSIIVGTVVRCARRWSETSQAIHEELVQDAYFKLFRERHSLLERLAEIPEQAIHGFIKVFTANLVHDHFRSHHASKRAPSNGLLELNVDQAPPVGVASTARIEREILLDKINELLTARVNGAYAERDRQIFWLHHRHGMTAREIASIPSVQLTEKGVESVLFRTTAVVKHALSGAKGKHTAGAC
jgi:RNA polymerase sigma-70 factor, ECF subfamily